MIRVASVSKRYGNTCVVDDVTVSLGAARGRDGAGSVTAIIGPNGAGKSTLLSMIARLAPIDGGRIEVDGLDVSRTRGTELATRLAVLRQDNHLSARLTVRELVGFGRYPYSRGRLTVADRAVIDEALDYLDLAALAGRHLDELSGGQRQRAFIAMVLAQDTEYLLLDEPLNNLDLKHAVDIMRLLRRAADEKGKRVVLVLHDINFASVHADEIVAMQNGRVVVQGPVAAVMRPDVLERVYGMPVAVRESSGALLADYYR